MANSITGQVYDGQGILINGSDGYLVLSHMFYSNGIISWIWVVGGKRMGTGVGDERKTVTLKVSFGL